jgi:hypothetical protein
MERAVSLFSSLLLAGPQQHRRADVPHADVPSRTRSRQSLMVPIVSAFPPLTAN